MSSSAKDASDEAKHNLAVVTHKKAIERVKGVDPEVYLRLSRLPTFLKQLLADVPMNLKDHLRCQEALNQLEELL